MYQGKYLSLRVCETENYPCDKKSFSGTKEMSAWVLILHQSSFVMVGNLVLDFNCKNIFQKQL